MFGSGNFDISLNIEGANELGELFYNAMTLLF